MPNLYIFLEGNDDERFFKTILEKKFKQKYEVIQFVKYAQMKEEKVNNYIKSIKSMKHDILFVCDIDNYPCKTSKKDYYVKKLNNINKNNIFIVIKEIESWYLAGLDEKSSEFLKIKHFKDTNEITKEKLQSIIPQKYDSKVDFMQEVLKKFNIEIALDKNESFRYFYGKNF